jgi:hypothetical protein
MIIVFLLPLANRISILVNFQLNRETIAAILCIRKEEPITVCGGKCYLAEKLNETSDDQEAPLRPSKEQKPLTIYFENSAQEVLTPPGALKTNIQSYIDSIYDPAHLSDIFHPPRLS